MFEEILTASSRDVNHLHETACLDDHSSVDELAVSPARTSCNVLASITGIAMGVVACAPFGKVSLSLVGGQRC